MPIGSHHSSAAEKPSHKCTRCPETDLSKFGLKSGRMRSTCRACTNAENAASRKRVREADPEAYQQRNKRWCKEARRRLGERAAVTYRKERLKNKYGMTLADFDTLLLKQNGVCAICEGEKGKGRHWHIDHDHATGAVRGILCNRCNTGLGSFRDNVRSLMRAAAYLGGGRTVWE